MDIAETIRRLVVTALEALGYPGLSLVMLIENILPPIPSEVILPLAGSLTVQGTYSLLGVTLAGSLGSTVGAWVFYYVGRAFGEERTRRLVRRYGGWLLLRESDLDAAMAFFRRHGEWAVVVGRMVPIIRSLISVPAGVARMSPVRFSLWTALGSAGWSLALAYAGRLLGQNWQRVTEAVGDYQVLVVVLAGAVVVALAVREAVRQVQSTGR